MPVPMRDWWNRNLGTTPRSTRTRRWPAVVSPRGRPASPSRCSPPVPDTSCASKRPSTTRMLHHRLLRQRRYELAGTGDRQACGNGADPSDQRPRPYMKEVTLPGAPCTACTVRVRQVMMESRGGESAPCPPVPLMNVPTYFSCANVVMSGGASPDGGTDGATGIDMAGGAGGTGGAGGAGGAAGSGGSGGSSGGTWGSGGSSGSGGSGGTGGSSGGSDGSTVLAARPAP